MKRQLHRVGHMKKRKVKITKGEETFSNLILFSCVAITPDIPPGVYELENVHNVYL